MDLEKDLLLLFKTLRAPDNVRIGNTKILISSPNPIDKLFNRIGFFKTIPMSGNSIWFIGKKIAFHQKCVIYACLSGSLKPY